MYNTTVKMILTGIVAVFLLDDLIVEVFTKPATKSKSPIPHSRMSAISARCDLYDPTRMNNVYGRIKLVQKHIPNIIVPSANLSEPARMVDFGFQRCKYVQFYIPYGCKKVGPCANLKYEALPHTKCASDGSNLVQVTGRVYGLTPGLHGFHVHRDGNFGYNCSNAGPHFNPFNKQHGSPIDTNRHVGDLGNIWANNWGIADVIAYDNVMQLQVPHGLTIIGRGIVVHANPDDFGRGRNEESLETGNAGGRLACCQIKRTLY